MNAVKRVQLAALILGAVAASSAAPEESLSSVSDQFSVDEVVVAYYEVAPRSMSASMRLAVERECATANMEEYPWLCGRGPLYFVRGVDQWGRKRNTGFVCKGAAGRKYFPVNAFGEHSDCLPVRYDSESKAHYVWR
jgi:hypothetical protein